MFHTFDEMLDETSTSTPDGCANDAQIEVVDARTS